MTDPLADYLRVDAGFESAGGVGVPEIMKRHPRKSCGRREPIETLSDRVGVWRPAVLEGEHIVARVVVAAEEIALAVLNLAPPA